MATEKPEPVTPLKRYGKPEETKPGLPRVPDAPATPTPVAPITPAE
jgi:hypothetical protein